MCGPYGWVFEKVCTYDGCFLGHPSTYHGYFLEILPPLQVKWLDYRISLQNYPIFANYGLVSRKFCNYDGCFLHESPRMALMYCGLHMLSKFPSEYPPPARMTPFSRTHNFQIPYSRIHILEAPFSRTDQF